jgi:hypothetical protein
MVQIFMQRTDKALICCMLLSKEINQLVLLTFLKWVWILTLWTNVHVLQCIGHRFLELS